MTLAPDTPAPAGVDLEAVAAALDLLGEYPLDVVGRAAFGMAHAAAGIHAGEPEFARAVAGVWQAVGVAVLERRDRLVAFVEIGRLAGELAAGTDPADLVDEGALAEDDPISRAALDLGDGSIVLDDGTELVVERGVVVDPVDDQADDDAGDGSA